MKAVLYKFLATFISFVIFTTMLPIDTALSSAPVWGLSGFALAESEGAEPLPSSKPSAPTETPENEGNMPDFPAPETETPAPEGSAQPEDSTDNPSQPQVPATDDGSTPAPETTPEVIPDAPQGDVPEVAPDIAEELNLESLPDGLALLNEKSATKASSVQIEVEGTPVKEAKIDITADPANIELTAVVKPGGARQEVEWKVSQKGSIVSIEPNGLKCTVTGLKVGEVTITATAKDGSKKKATCKVSVYKPVTDIEEISDIVLALGSKKKVTAKVLPEDATSKAITWTSSNKKVVTVDGKGNLTATKKLPAESDRTVTITATSVENPAITKSFSVTVYPAVTSVKIMQGDTKVKKLKLVRNNPDKPEDGTAELRALLAPATGTYQAVEWTSSKPHIAKVEKKDDLTCTVTALKAGTTVITAVAKDGSGKKATFTVTVEALLESISIQPVSDGLAAGNKVQLKAVYEPDDATNKAVIWTVNDPAVATVDKKGVLKASNKPTVREKKEVTVFIKSAANSDIRGEIAVNILPRTTSVKILGPGGDNVTKEKLVVNGSEEQKTIQLSVEIKPDDASTSVKWTSSKPKVAKVDQNGLVTAVGTGKATITATAKDGTKAKASCTINVVKKAETIEIVGPTDVVSGSETGYSVKISPKDTTDKSVLWEISEPTFESTISNKGVLTAGSVTGNETKVVTIAALPKDQISSAANLNVTIHPKATSVDILVGEERPESATIHLKTSKKLELTAEVGESSAIQKVKWVSSNPKVATVIQNGDLGATVTGKAKGTTIISAISSDGNARDSLTLTVKDDKKFQIVLNRNVDTIYLDKCEEGIAYTWGTATVEGLPSGQTGKWILEPDGNEDGFPAKLEKSVSPSRIYIYYEDVRKVGSATYTLSFSTDDGAYSASVEIPLKVVDTTPVDAPTFITYPMDDQKLDVNKSMTFRVRDIRVPAGTQVPEGVYSSRSFYLSRSIYISANCSYSYESSGDVKVTFKKAGRYVVTAVLSYGNITLTKDIVITVGAPAFKLGITYYNKYAYASDAKYYDWDTVGYLETIGYDLTEEEEARAEWTLTPLSSAANEAGAAATLRMAELEPRYIEYRLNSGTGNVTYLAVLTLADGQSASVNIALEVKTTKGLPTGLKVPKTAYSLKPGGSITLYDKDIAFTGGSVPSSVVVSKSYYGYWDEGDVEEYYLDSGKRFTFHTPGIYIIYAAGWISNYYLERTITVTVGDANNPPFRLSAYFDYSTFYRPGEGEESYNPFGRIEARNFPKEEDGENDCIWTIERLSAPDGFGENDCDVVSLDNEETDTAENWLSCDLYGDTPLGTYVYKITATTGKYTDDVTIQVEVRDSAGLPSGISVDPSILKITIDVGEPVFLAYDKIQFASGTAPEEASVSRYFYSEGENWNWDTIEEEWEDDGLRCTFHSPGRYWFRPTISISNLSYESDKCVEILVCAESGAQFEIDLNQYILEMFEDGAEQGIVGTLTVKNFSLNEDESFQWSITPKGNDADFPVFLSLNDVSDARYKMAVRYALKSGTGTATYTITATCGEYSASRDISVTVSGLAPTGYPTGIKVKQTEYDVVLDEDLYLYLSDITFANGNVPSGAKVWRSLTPRNDWNWDGADYYLHEEEEEIHCYFYEEGEYVLTAQIGIGNYSFAQDIVINVVGL